MAVTVAVSCSPGLTWAGVATIESVNPDSTGTLDAVVAVVVGTLVGCARFEGEAATLGVSNPRLPDLPKTPREYAPAPNPVAAHSTSTRAAASACHRLPDLARSLMGATVA
jgi:hypothetical protein